MGELDPNATADDLTSRVLNAMATASDPRARVISEAIVRHLHALVREVRPSIEEWQLAIEFLTAVGRTCAGERQEFVLLSDVLGVSMLVEELNAPSGPGVTESTVLGPFYVENPPRVENGASIGDSSSGIPLFFEGEVLDTTGRPVPEVDIDTWQADPGGQYDVQYEDGEMRLRARLTSDSAGKFSFWSVVPSSYPVPSDGPVGALLQAQARQPYRPAHVHFRLMPPGGRVLTTHLFVAGDPYLDCDVVFGVRESLVETFSLHDPKEADREITVPFAWVRRTFVLPAT